MIHQESRWGKWFASRVNASGISKYKIAKALRIQPSRINAWEDGRRGVRSDGAFNYGQRLMELGVPGTSGPIALHAAGYTIESMMLLKRMSMIPYGKAHAVTLYCTLPRLNNWLNSDTESMEEMNSIHPLEKHMRNKNTALHMYDEAWQYKDERTPSGVLRGLYIALIYADFAIEIAKSKKDYDNRNLFYNYAWWVMSMWARWIHPETLVNLYDIYLADYISDPLTESRKIYLRSPNDKE